MPGVVMVICFPKYGKKFKDIKLYGIEFSPDLLKLAKSRKIPDCQIVAGDLREKIPFKEKFNLIITERVIINILDFKEQRKCLDESEVLHVRHWTLYSN